VKRSDEATTDERPAVSRVPPEVEAAKTVARAPVKRPPPPRDRLEALEASLAAHDTVDVLCRGGLPCSAGRCGPAWLVQDGDALLRFVTLPDRWEDVLQRLVQAGHTDVLELWSGSALDGLLTVTQSEGTLVSPSGDVLGVLELSHRMTRVELIDPTGPTLELVPAGSLTVSAVALYPENFRVLRARVEVATVEAVPSEGILPSPGPERWTVRFTPRLTPWQRLLTLTGLVALDFLRRSDHQRPRQHGLGGLL